MKPRVRVSLWRRSGAIQTFCADWKEIRVADKLAMAKIQETEPKQRRS